MAPPAPSTAACRKWIKGTCQHGQQCRFSHESNPSTPKTPAKPGSSPSATRTPEEASARKKFFKNRNMMKDSGKLLNIFNLSKIQKAKTDVGIESFSFIASYNWRNSDDPTIFVPGCPPRLTFRSFPYQVAKDNGQVFIDQNAHRSPSARFDPFFKALLTMHPNFDMKPIKLATDRNSLRKLLQFASGKITKSWRIDVDIFEDTMFFSRWEEKQVQFITGSHESGYGHEFEKAFLSFDSNLQESSGHHRIVRYNLGGIECLVRYEADGYIDDGTNVENAASTVEELGQALTGLEVQDPKTPPATSTIAEVKVIERGRLVEDNTSLELKSRSLNMSLKLQEFLPQLWISQTRNLFVGRHKDGLVEVQPEKFDMLEHFPTWETKNQEHLKALVGLILEIQTVMRRVKGRKCMLVVKSEEKPRVLRVFERNGKELFLPKKARETCWRNET